ncbi:MAG: EamA family transporter [Chloroflexi bacterium]|nr:EamA family transporter [Chloroflexota bacterium]
MGHSSTRGYVFVLLAAILWGTLGIFFRSLYDDFGLSGLTIPFLRAVLTGAILLTWVALTQPRLLRIPRRAIPFFIAYGFCAVAAFYFTYTNAVIQTSVTTAVVLLYTAPAFVTLMAWRAWREPLNARKVLALVLAFAGCAFVARAYDLSQLRLNAVGILLGLGAGFTYALYTIFSKFALAEFESLTALVYALLIGALFLAPFQSFDAFAPLAQRPAVWLSLLGLVLGPTIGSYVFYNIGLKHVPASNASLVATIEPVIASALAFILLGERVEVLQILGGVMVIGGAVVSRQ